MVVNIVTKSSNNIGQISNDEIKNDMEWRKVIKEFLREKLGEFYPKDPKVSKKIVDNIIYALDKNHINGLYSYDIDIVKKAFENISKSELAKVLLNKNDYTWAYLNIQLLNAFKEKSTLNDKQAFMDIMKATFTGSVKQVLNTLEEYFGLFTSLNGKNNTCIIKYPRKSTLSSADKIKMIEEKCNKYLKDAKVKILFKPLKFDGVVEAYMVEVHLIGNEDKEDVWWVDRDAVNMLSSIFKQSADHMVEIKEKELPDTDKIRNSYANLPLSEQVWVKKFINTINDENIEISSAFKIYKSLDLFIKPKDKDMIFYEKLAEKFGGTAKMQKSGLVLLDFVKNENAVIIAKIIQWCLMGGKLFE